MASLGPSLALSRGAPGTLDRARAMGCDFFHGAPTSPAAASAAAALQGRERGRRPPARPAAPRLTTAQIHARLATFHADVAARSAGPGRSTAHANAKIAAYHAREAARGLSARPAGRA